MTKIAIDIVLLPPEEIMDLSLEINKRAVEEGNDLVKLDKEKCIPHMTLCMGAVDEEGLPEIKEFLNQIKDQFSKLKLKIIAINGEHAAFDIERTEELQKLHKTIMKKVQPYIIANPTVEMCYSPPPVAERTLFWLRNYRERTSYENYYPHITLAKNSIEEKQMNLEFTASRLALCHLGTYCTCRKILFSTELHL
jgi:2'-5' RNA ligase